MIDKDQRTPRSRREAFGYEDHGVVGTREHSVYAATVKKEGQT